MPAAQPFPLTHDIVRALAGDRAYERGTEYFWSGRVTTFIVDAEHVTAVVRGTEDYRVLLAASTDSAVYECSCPVGDDAVFCKHCVAVALVWLKQRSASGESYEVHAAARSSTQVSSGETEPPRKRTTSTQVSGAAYKQIITAAFRIRDFVEYRAARAYAERIRQALFPVEQLLGTAQAASVIELTEHALKCLERAQGRVDDSDGHTVEIREWLHDMHYAACDQVRPEPTALARRLFARELGSELDVFHGSAARYAHILGAAGLTVYRALATVQWANVPFLKPGADNFHRYGKRFRITKMMESLAIASGDVEELVAVMQRDLSHAYHFVLIVDVYEKAGKNEAALEWAERGLKAFPKKTDKRLLEILARQYVRANRDDDAMAVVWRVFTEQFTVAHYEQLHAFAHPMQRWPEWRAKALRAIRDSMAKRVPNDNSPNSAAHWSTNGSLLVDIFLWENTPDVAWTEAQALGCSSDHWMRLARLREIAYPDDAARVYQHEVTRVLQQADKRAYRDGVAVLRDVARAMNRAGRGGEFAAYLAKVRSLNKARKNFLALLDAAF